MDPDNQVQSARELRPCWINRLRLHNLTRVSVEVDEHFTFDSLTKVLLSVGMSKSDSFWDHPVATLEEALSLRKQIHSLQTKLSSLFGSISPSAAAKPRKAGRRTMSAAARAKIAAAQRARWAKGRAPAAAKSDSGATVARRKGKMSAAGKAKIAAAQKARWAKIKGQSAQSAVKKEVTSPKSGKAKTAGSKRKSGLTDAGRAKLAAAMKARWAARKKGAAAPNARGK